MNDAKKKHADNRRSLAVFNLAPRRKLAEPRSLEDASRELRKLAGPLGKKDALFPLPEVGPGWVPLFGARNFVVAAKAGSVRELVKEMDADQER